MDGLLDGSGGDSAGLENLGSPGGRALFGLGLGLDEHGFVDDELANVLGGDQLGVSIVDHLVNDFVNEHKVLADGLFVEDAAVVAEDLHHAVDDVHNGGRRHVRLARRHEVDAKLFREEVVHAVDVLSRRTN